MSTPSRLSTSAIASAAVIGALSVAAPGLGIVLKASTPFACAPWRRRRGLANVGSLRQSESAVAGRDREPRCSAARRRATGRAASIGRNADRTGGTDMAEVELFHAEPGSNSLKVLQALKEKGVPFVSRYVNLRKFEQHDPEFLKV